MQMVAEAAGVAVQTVYFVFGTKARLLADVENRVVLGDAPLDPLGRQPWVAEMQRETDPNRLLALFVEVSTDIVSRISPFVAAVGPALPSDADRSRHAIEVVMSSLASSSIAWQRSELSATD
jgi:AcrR family transcriptional regulator